jgi:pyruvyltransferase
MKIRTFYWMPAARGRRNWRRGWRRSPTRWRFGNAGDTFNRDLLGLLYPSSAHQIVESGPRLLMVGSISHRISSGDVVVGAGIKTDALPGPERAAVTVLGVRGPLTYEAFAAAGHDVAAVRFQFDPGLLIPKLLTEDELSIQPVLGRTIFIPHFRDADAGVNRIASVETVAIDSDPIPLAREILAAELVYSSSLHGIIFAHALGRPCVPVQPASAEPLIKYADYFASVGLSTRMCASLAEATRSTKPDSPIDRPWSSIDQAFPTLAELSSWGVAI